MRTADETRDRPPLGVLAAPAGLAAMGTWGLVVVLDKKFAVAIAERRHLDHLAQIVGVSAAGPVEGVGRT